MVDTSHDERATTSSAYAVHRFRLPPPLALFSRLPPPPRVGFVTLLYAEFSLINFLLKKNVIIMVGEKGKREEVNGK